MQTGDGTEWSEPISVDEDTPHPIWFAKAAYQLGYSSLVRQVDGRYEIRLPVGAQDEITERATWLAERDAKGLPVNPLPCGRFPDSEEEFADQILVAVIADPEHGEVYVDFARPLRAIGISPAMARTIAMKLMEVADGIDPDGSAGMKNPATVTIGHIRVPGSDITKEGAVVMPGVLDDLCFLGPGEDADVSENDLDSCP